MESTTRGAKGDRFSRASATRKERVVYKTMRRECIQNDRILKLDKFLSMIQYNERTEEMFLREVFTQEDTYVLLTAIAAQMKKRINNRFETVTAQAV
jgi:hypothetical protein